MTTFNDRKQATLTTVFIRWPTVAAFGMEEETQIIWTTLGTQTKYKQINRDKLGSTRR